MHLYYFYCYCYFCMSQFVEFHKSLFFLSIYTKYSVLYYGYCSWGDDELAAGKNSKTVNENVW